jgi:subtilisin family serine protease
MSARHGKAQGVALAGVAAVGLLVGGMVFVGSGGANAGVPVKPVLEGSAPQWADGYNHFILTMSGPVPLVADGSVIRGFATGKPAGGQRRAAGKAGQASVRQADQASVRLSAGKAPGVVTKGAHSPQGAPGPQGAGGSQGARSTGIPAQQDGIPWQAVTPNSANPIVWRPGQPISVLARNLARYPKGTTLERDSEGNIRAVLPRGTKFTPPAQAPAPPGAGRPPATAPAGGGRPPATTGKRPASATYGKYPPGWGPDSQAIASSLLKVPGVHSASPVWGTRYQIATTLSAAQVRALPGVKAVAPNNLMAFSSLPETNDPDLSDEYYLANAGQTVLSQAGTSGDSADFSYAWARSRGSGVVIADIDTGVDLTNPDLSGQILAASENFSVSPPTSEVQAEGSASGFYHATTVDGVMVAIGGNGWGGAGAAPEAKVLALKCSDDGSLADSCIYAAGEYAITQHVQVINMSFGEAVSSDPTLASLVSDAETAGILVTASAGNAGTDNDSSPVLPANYATTYPNVISVGATDNQDNLASYSDYGATTVDVMAPGTDMFTDYPTYSGFDNAYVSGTSYAAPMVASTAALLWSVDPALTYAQVKGDILTSVHDVAGLSGKCVTGGVVDAQAALASVQEPVRFSFTGFDEVVPSQVAQVSVSASAQAGALPSATPLGYHLELLYNYSGTMYDVVDQALDWSMGGGGAQAVATAGDGTAFIAPAGITSTNYGANPLDLTVPSPGLPSGTYALVAYAATTGAPTVPIGNRQAVFFNVGQPSPTPVPSTTTTTAGGATTTTAIGGTTTTTAIGGTTTTAAGGTTTTTAGGTTTTGAGGTTTTVAGGTTTTTTAVGGTTTTTSVAGTTTTVAGTTTTTGAGATTTTLPPTTVVNETQPSVGQGTSTTVAATTTTTSGATTTTAPGGTTTTAAAGTTTTTAATTTTTASFTIDSLTPNELPQTGGDLSIFGNNFPSNPVVTVGAVHESVSSATSSEIDIMVAAITPGNYTVTVYNAGQTQSASLPNGLTIDGAGGTTTTTSAGGTTTTTAPGATTTTTSGGATTTTIAGGTTTTAGAATTTTANPATTTTAAGVTTTTAQVTTTTGPGGTIAGPGGMTLAPVSGSNPIGGVTVGEWPAFTASQLISDNGGSAGSAVDGVDV